MLASMETSTVINDSPREAKKWESSLTMKEFNYLTYCNQDEFYKYQGTGCIFNKIHGLMKFAKTFKQSHNDDCDILSLSSFRTLLLLLRVMSFLSNLDE